MKQSLNEGSVLKNLIYFSLPFMLSSFLQTLYGLVDLYIIGMFHGSECISAVSMGSQVTHMLIVIIIGLSMGVSVGISRAIGAKNYDKIKTIVKNGIVLFLVLSFILMISLLFGCDLILKLLATPIEAYMQAKNYLLTCFVGIPFIVFYNFFSSIYRGLGDSKTPMYFVVIAGILNIILDYVFVGILFMEAFGAALATMISQAVSAILAFIVLQRRHQIFSFTKKITLYEKNIMYDLLKVGCPIAFQDGLIQIAFLTITMIANTQGVDVSASVGIVEKIIGFVFLIPSAMLASVSAICAQCAGANLHKRSKQTLQYAMIICLLCGFVFVIICTLMPNTIMALFTNSSIVIYLGSTYLLSYIWDCMIAGVHFCFSGYFCAYEKSMLSFVHNIVSIVVMRIPGAYLASLFFKDSLFMMGMAAPLGSLISVIICVYFYKKYYNSFYKVV